MSSKIVLRPPVVMSAGGGGSWTTNVARLVITIFGTATLHCWVGHGKACLLARNPWQYSTKTRLPEEQERTRFSVEICRSALRVSAEPEASSNPRAEKDTVVVLSRRLTNDALRII